MLTVVQQALESILTFFVIGSLGYVLDKKGWFKPESKALIPRLLLFVTLPPYLFVHLVQTFDRSHLAELFYGSFVPVLYYLISITIGSLIAKIGRIHPGRQGVFKVGFSFSNAVFIGLPINIALFGEIAVPYVLIYFVSNTAFFWTIGNYWISCDGDQPSAPIISIDGLKKLFSPPLLGFLIGVLFLFFRIPVPDFLIKAGTYLGDITSPLAMIFIGITLSGIHLREVKFDRDLILLLLGRFVINPSIIIVLVLLAGLPTLMAKVFIIQSALPVLANSVLVASYYRADMGYASVSVALSTLLSLGVIPIYMLVITLLPL